MLSDKSDHKDQTVPKLTDWGPVLVHCKSFREPPTWRTGISLEYFLPTEKVRQSVSGLLLLRFLVAPWLSSRAALAYSGWSFSHQTRWWVGVNLDFPEPCFPTPGSCGQERALIYEERGSVLVFHRGLSVITGQAWLVGTDHFYFNQNMFIY